MAWGGEGAKARGKHGSKAADWQISTATGCGDGHDACCERRAVMAAVW